jgi:hypothetical protein
MERYRIVEKKDELKDGNIATYYFIEAAYRIIFFDIWLARRISMDEFEIEYFHSLEKVQNKKKELDEMALYRHNRKVVKSRKSVL